MLPEPSQRTFWICVILLLLIHLGITAPLASSLNVWTDEASSLYATQNGFWVAFQTATAEQKQAPLYFWMLSIWRVADDSIFFARLFSIVCSLGAIVGFAALARRFFSDLGAIAVTAFFALHPFLIWASIEIRVYSMVVLLSVALIHLFFKGFFANDESDNCTRSQWWFLGLVVVSLYSNYYLGFLIAGFFFSLILTGRWRAATRYAGMMVLAGIAFLPLALAALTELKSRSSGSQTHWTLIDGVKIVWNHVLTFLLPTEIFSPEQQSVASLFRVWIVRLGLAATAILAIWKRNQITSQAVAVAVLAATISASLIAAGYLVGPSLIVIRHASMMFAAVVLGFTLLIRDIFAESSWKIRSAAIAAAFPLFIASFVYGITNIYPAQTKRGDWASVAQYIEQNESKGEPIIVFPTFDALSPRYHYRGLNEILPNERFFDFIPGASPRSPDELKSEIEFVISEVPTNADRIWLTVGDVCTNNVGCSPLQNYIEANYTIESETNFYMGKLYLLKKRPQ